MKGKRGIFFTMIAITLLSLLAVSLTIISISHERASVTKRIGTLNEYVFSVEEDMTRKLFISGFRIIFLYEKRMFESGEYADDVQALFEEAFFNGTLNGTANSDEQSLLSGVLYSDIQTDLANGAKKFNLNITLAQPSVTVDQIDPWNIRFGMTTTLLIEDVGGLASWNRSGTFYAFVPIENFEDPIYIIKTNGVFTPKVRKTPYDPLVLETNLTSLISHIEGSYYIATDESPNFLGRLEGNLSANPNGVESLVSFPNLTASGMAVSDKSNVDHIYFSNSNPSKKKVIGMPSWFKIDSAHEGTYNLTNLTI